jgi:hypothetical protein
LNATCSTRNRVAPGEQQGQADHHEPDRVVIERTRRAASGPVREAAARAKCPARRGQAYQCHDTIPAGMSCAIIRAGCEVEQRRAQCGRLRPTLSAIRACSRRVEENYRAVAD